MTNVGYVCLIFILYNRQCDVELGKKHFTCVRWVYKNRIYVTCLFVKYTRECNVNKLKTKRKCKICNVKKIPAPDTNPKTNHTSFIIRTRAPTDLHNID